MIHEERKNAAQYAQEAMMDETFTGRNSFGKWWVKLSGPNRFFLSPFKIEKPVLKRRSNVTHKSEVNINKQSVPPSCAYCNRNGERPSDFARSGSDFQ
jgi:hypothetical protein